MPEPQIRFEDGAAYERMMGVWSRLAGEVFVDWLAPELGLRWLDVGCGSGAFSQLLVDRCAPTEVQGIDPSEAQLVFARTRPAARLARFQQGSAIALPFADGGFDAGAMALVIFFVPEPAKAIAEMVRVVRSGGIIAAYAWDMLGGGYPGEALPAEMSAMGKEPPLPPSVGASRREAMRELWTDAGLQAVETREITISRTFADFEEFWTLNLKSSRLAHIVSGMSAAELQQLKDRVRGRMPPGVSGRITTTGRANAVKGRVPG